MGLLSTPCQRVVLRCLHCPPISKSLTMAELGLKKKEIDAIDFAFDVYDFKGDGKVDAFYAGDLIRACNLNPTLKTIAEIGGTTEKGQDDHQGRGLPHVQGLQGLQGPGRLPRLR